MLAQIAYGKEWHTLKKERIEGQIDNGQTEDNKLPRETMLESSLPFEVPLPRRQKKLNSKAVLLMTVLGAFVLLLAASAYYTNTNKKKAFNSISFAASPTAEMRIPNSVVFDYDVSGIQADHFYIQQSWDPARRVEIFPENKTQTDIYYEPGYHYAKLLVDDEVAREIPVHIKYNDWYVRFRFPDSELLKVDDADLSKEDGHLGLKAEYVMSRVNSVHAEDFQLGYMLSKDFNLPADEFQINASVKFDSALAPVCPRINLLIKGDRDYAWITLGNVGCESNLGLKVGATRVDGKTNDLSLLGIDVFSWQQVQVRISKGSFRLLINDRLAHEGTYSNSLGQLKEIDFFFNGIGSIAEITTSGL
jgi:hypothetical protein